MGSLGQPSPSHSAQPVAALPCAENLLDAAADTLDGVVPAPQLAQRIIAGPAPHAGQHDPGRTAPGGDRRSKDRPAIGAVGVDFARGLGQRTATGPAIMDVAGVTQSASTRAVSASALTCALKLWTALRRW